MNTITPKDAQANDTLQAIYQRRAIRVYQDKPVPKDIIDQLIDAGRMAPSAINKQPWRFYVLTRKQLIKAFSSEISKVAEKFFHMSHGVDVSKSEDFIFHGAPVVIFITAPKDNEWASLDIGMCAQNIMLAAKSMGLDTCPVGLAKFIEQTPLYSELKVQKDEKVMLAVIVGYGNEQADAKERKKDNVVFLI